MKIRRFIIIVTVVLSSVLSACKNPVDSTVNHLQTNCNSSVAVGARCDQMLP